MQINHFLVCLEKLSHFFLRTDFSYSSTLDLKKARHIDLNDRFMMKTYTRR